MTVVADLDAPTRPSAPAAAPTAIADESQPDERGSLPVTGLVTLGTSAAFAVWTSLTCFVC